MGKTLAIGEDARGVCFYEASRLTPEQFLSYWPMVVRELDLIAHVWDTYWTKEFIRDAAMQGRFQVWGFGPPESIRIMVFTQVVYYPANTILEIVLAFGNGLRESLPLIEATFERFALELNCGVCEIRGRKGWLRWLRRRGFTWEAVVLRRKVERLGVH